MGAASNFVSQVDEDKLIDICSRHQSTSAYGLGASTKAPPKAWIVLRFRRYYTMCENTKGKTQMAAWWQKGERGRPGKGLLKLKVD